MVVRRVHFSTLGCPKNLVDTEHMRAALAGSAYEPANDPEDADVVVVNTCAFITPAVEESIDVVLEFASTWRAARADRRLVVAGCLPARYGADLADALPEVDAFVPVAEEENLLAHLGAVTGLPTHSSPGSLRLDGGPSAYLKVSEGCDRRCSYCAIPSIRGPQASVPIEHLASEALELVERGARELVLVGQDTTAYGAEADEDLPTLLRRLCTIEGLEWLRVMYAQPDGVTDELLETMAELPQVCAYLDLPLQHASRRVLRDMGRRGDADAHLELLERVRAHLPGVSLRSTFIAGFPDETEDDVDVLEAFLRAARFDHAGVLVYSPEDGTHAAAMPGHVPESVRVQRAQRLQDVIDTMGAQRAGARIGHTLEVLVEEGDPDEPHGRTRGQAPEVDGVVLLQRRHLPGTMLHVRIGEACGYDLIGEATA